MTPHCPFCDHPTRGSRGLHCTRCGVEDDSIALDPEGGPDLCAACQGDADERAMAAAVACPATCPPFLARTGESCSLPAGHDGPHTIPIGDIDVGSSWIGDEPRVHGWLDEPDERENEGRSSHTDADRGGGPTSPDVPAAGRAVLVEHAPAAHSRRLRRGSPTMSPAEAERIVARVAYAERDAAHAALAGAGVDDGHEDGDPPTGYDLATRIGLLVEERDALRADLAWHEEHHGTRAEREAEEVESEALWERIEAMSDEELDAVIVEEGGDPEAIAERGRSGARWAIERALRYHDLRKERDELRLVLLAEQGDPAGAPSEGWTWSGASGDWCRAGARVGRTAWLRNPAGDRCCWWWDVPDAAADGHAPTAREAMRAADAAAEGDKR